LECLDRGTTDSSSLLMARRTGSSITPMLSRSKGAGGFAPREYSRLRGMRMGHRTLANLSRRRPQFQSLRDS